MVETQAYSFVLIKLCIHKFTLIKHLAPLKSPNSTVHRCVLMWGIKILFWDNTILISYSFSYPFNFYTFYKILSYFLLPKLNTSSKLQIISTRGLQ